MTISRALSRARQLDAAATSPKWRYVHILDGINARALIDGNGYHFGQIDDLENGALIALLRNSNKVALDVITIAADVAHALRFAGKPDHRLEQALEAWAKAVEGGGDG